MTLSERAHFTATGRPKVTYDQTAAEARATRDGGHAYRCWYCGGWHVGGATRNAKHHVQRREAKNRRRNRRNR